MEIRPFRRPDASRLATLAATFARAETDFVLNPLWETRDELFAEFERHATAPEEHLLVAEDEIGGALGVVGFLRYAGESTAALIAPIVEREERGRGVGGRLLRAAFELGERLEIRLVTAALGSRNRSGHSLLTAHGFRPVRQHVFMQCDRPASVPPASGVVLDFAGEEDIGGMIDLLTEAGFPPPSEETMRSELANGQHAWAVARKDGRDIAFVELETHWPRRVWVSYVGVSPTSRERGVGSSLVAWALEQQFAAGAEKAMLMLSPANRAALRAYEKVGFDRFRLIDVLEKPLG
ncbi:MAG: GNAT family N-acetyltransferase [Myxococcota bacterium]